MSEYSGLEIAVVGIAGRFPGSADVESYWANLRRGADCITRFSKEELLAAGVDPGELEAPGYVPAAGVIEGEDLFDAAFFDYTPREAEALDPQHRIFLELCWEALERAGYAPGEGSAPVGVYAGAAASGYLLHNLLANPEVVRALGAFQLSIGSEQAYLAPRVSYKLDLAGPSVSVANACSTSLVAVHLACQGLLNGECDMALAGGAAFHIPHRSGYLYEPGGIDSPDGHCRAFDARAEGTVSGGGAGVVVLKRLADAERDGDRILAVVKGSAVNNDAGRRLGFTAPGPEGQAAVIRMAQTMAEVDPATVAYVETHGTATRLGDRVEVAALKKAFEGSAAEPGSCVLGAVKTNVGHLGEAAGVAGLIKTVLALHHGEIPPNHDFREPAPDLELPGSPFRVSGELAPWPVGAHPRRAGVSSFGIGGTNAHVVLEEAPPAEPSGPSRPWQLLALSARTESAAEQAVARLAEHLERHPELPLADVAYTLQTGRKTFEHRRMLVCRDTAEAAELLAARDPRRLLGHARETGHRPVAFLFSGLGDQYPEMALDLYRGEPVFRDALDRCTEGLARHLGVDVREALFPKGTDAGRTTGSGGLDFKALVRGGGASPEHARLDRTGVAQPALFAVEYALSRLLDHWGVRPQAVIGYSLGEYVAATVAGVLAEDDALELVAVRAKLIEELPAGAMSAVPLPAKQIEPLLGSDLSLAAVNSPDVCVVSGPAEAVERLEAELSERGLACRRLKTTHAFHSPMMKGVAERLTGLVRGFELKAPEIPYLSNVTGTWITPEEATDPGYWARHLVQPVRFAQGIAELWGEPDRILLELGPGQGLVSLALQQLPDEPGERVALPALPHVHEGRDDLSHLLTTVGRLWLEGVRLDAQGFWGEERRLKVELPGYPFERRRYWIEAPRRGGGVVVDEVGMVDGVDTEQGEALAAHQRPRLRTAFVAARNDVERRIVEIWRELLGIEEVGVFDSFFELGGHSLLGTQLVARLRTVFGVEVALEQLFAEPTVADLAAAVGEPAASGPALVGRGETGPAPLAYSQERFWFLDRLQPGDPAFHISGAYRASGELSAPAVEAAVREILRRHEPLRSRIEEIDGVPFQVPLPVSAFRLPRVDLSRLEAAHADRRLAAHAREVAVRPFDLAGGPLLSFVLARLDAREHGALLNMHHVASDGWSAGVFVQELAALYPELAGGRPSPLPELAVTYADFARWQRERLDGEALAASVERWRGRLDGAPQVLELPTDRPRPRQTSHRGALHVERIGAARIRALEALGRDGRATLFMVLGAVVGALFGRLAGQRELLLGTPVAGRVRHEVEELIGLFVNTLVLRVDLAGGPSFADLVGRFRRTALDAFGDQEVPFERLVEALEPTRDLSRSPLFQLLVALQNTPSKRVETGGVTLTPLDAWREAAQLELTLFFEQEDDGSLSLSFQYNPDLYDASTIARWSRSLRRLLDAAAERPEAPVELLPLWSAAERHQVLAEWNDTAAAGPEPPTLVDRFAVAVVGAPDRLAVRWREQSLSFEALDRRSDALARRLRAAGVMPDEPVALYLDRDPETIAVMLAVWKAGGAYLPLDPTAPRERSASVLEDAGARVIVTRRALESELAGLPATPLALEAPGEEGEGPLPGPATPEGLAYVIYTSGSTGRPKGVGVSHRAAANLVDALDATVYRGAAPGLTVAVNAPLIFDASVKQIVQVLAGRTLDLVPEEVRLEPRPLVDHLERRAVDVLDATPSQLDLLLGEGLGRGSSPARVLVGGEGIRPSLWQRLQELPAVAFWNVYGPTETTVDATAQQVLVGESRPLLGRPLPNVRLVALDPDGRPVPVGVAGELAIGGAGVARGYLARPRLTAERFRPDPEGTPGARRYLSGDLARQRPAGTWEYLERLDFQLKVRGFRIEPGEIETVLSAHAAVRQAVVAARGDAASGQRLVAYLVPAHGAEIPVDELRRQAREALPDYMVPHVWMVLDSLPLTRTGKVDRKALPEPDASRPEQAVEYLAPRTATEEALEEVWKELLELERVGVLDDFFDLGGHSLLATRLLSRVEKRFGVELPLREVFEEPTIASLARRIDERGQAAGEADEIARLLDELEGMSDEEAQALLEEGVI